MKKQLIFSAVVLLAVLTMVSCKKYTAQTATLNDVNDSLNYALGYANGDGIKNYYMGELDDKEKAAALNEFIKALDKAFNSDATPDEMYELGLNIGNSLKQQEKDGLMGDADLKFDYKLTKKGLEDGMKGSAEGWAGNAQNYIQSTMMQIQAEKAAAALQESNKQEEAEEEELIIEEEEIVIEEEEIVEIGK